MIHARDGKLGSFQREINDLNLRFSTLLQHLAAFCCKAGFKPGSFTVLFCLL